MAQTYFPFDAGAGANTMEDQWTLMAQEWLGTGVIKNDALGELVVSANSSGMQVFVAPGKAWVQGAFFQSDASVTLPIAANASGNPRIDRIAVQLDKVANTVSLVVIQGTPGVTPVAPALTQTFNLWQISLAQVAVANGAVNIAAGNVTDERVYATAQTDRLDFAPPGASAAPDTFVKRAAAGGLVFNAAPITAVELATQASLTQTADQIQALDSNGNPLFRVAANGLVVGTAGVDSSGSPSGTNGGEFRFPGTGASLTSLISTLSTGAPLTAFDHRGSGNTGSWRWDNGTNGGTVRMSLIGAGDLQLPTGNVFAQYGVAGAQVKIGNIGPGGVAGLEFGGNTDYMGLIAGHRVGLFLNSVKLIDLQSSGMAVVGGDHYFGPSAQGGAGATLHIQASASGGSDAILMAESSLSDASLTLRYKGAGKVQIQNSVGTTQWTFDTSGNLISTGSGGTAMSFTGVGVIALHNVGALPSSTPTNGGVLYVNAGALRWRGSSGTDTQIAAA